MSSGPVENARGPGVPQGPGSLPSGPCSDALPRIPLRNPKARIALLGAILLGVAAVWAVLTLRDLGEQVEARFRGQLFAVPSRVYARPVTLRTGLDIERTRLRERLERMGYVQAVGAEQLKPGEFAAAPRLLRDLPAPVAAARTGPPRSS